MKKIIIAVLAGLVFAGCAKLDTPKLDSSCSLSTLKAYVYVDAEKLSASPTEVDLLSGMYIKEKGNASYTFPEDASKFNAQTLKRCRLEAAIPSTARLEMTDENGNGLGKGLEGFHDLYNQTFYFKVIAADGTFFQYKVSCKCKN